MGRFLANSLISVLPLILFSSLGKGPLIFHSCIHAPMYGFIKDIASIIKGAHGGRCLLTESIFLLVLRESLTPAPNPPFFRGCRRRRQPLKKKPFSLPDLGRGKGVGLNRSQKREGRRRAWGHCSSVGFFDKLDRGTGEKWQAIIKVRRGTFCIYRKNF